MRLRKSLSCCSKQHCAAIGKVGRRKRSELSFRDLGRDDTLVTAEEIAMHGRRHRMVLVGIEGERP